MRKMPNLRFKEFSECWKNTKIINEFDLSSGSTPSKANKSYFNGSNNWVTSGELKTKYLKSTIDKISDDAKDECNLKEYKPGTFVMAIYGLEASGTRGSCTILKTNATISQACMALVPKGYISCEFLYYWYMKYGEKIGRRYAQGTKQQNLNADLVGNIQIAAPTKKEQEKIVSLFSLIDNKIEAQRKKVELLEVYKKGMMQKIFLKELRFKNDDGRDYPEWKKIKLSKVLKERKTYSEKNQGLKHVTLSKQGIHQKDEKYNRDFLVVKDDKKYKITKLGDICYNPANLKFGVICRNDFGDAIFSPIYITFETKALADSEYLGLYMNRLDFINKVRKYEEGTVYERMSVKPEDFLRYEIDLPSIEEQKKISKFLNTIDNKIKHEEIKLELLNDYKRGLLQELII